MGINQYYILNGDALFERFPIDLNGELIVCRECLVDGNVSGINFKDFIENRVEFLRDNYGNSRTDYFEKTLSEFRKVQHIPTGSIINLWFEDDLFCQVNMYFLLSLINQFTTDSKVYLVRPRIHTQYGFGGLSQLELIQLEQEKIEINNVVDFAMLWEFYSNEKLDELRRKAEQLATDFPFVKDAVDAHFSRIPNENNPGRPIEVLKEIINELKTDNFGQIFQEFSRREPIYGFGDLQVKRLWEVARRKND